MEIITEPEWDITVQSLLQHRGNAIVIGATDSGKSTLIRYLLKRMVSARTSACLIDADIGQSSLGIPGTICKKEFANEGDLDNFTHDKMIFVGTLNPAKSIPLMIGGVRKMSEICKQPSGITLIDTTGLVSGLAGESLKIGKMKAVRPMHLIAVQRGEEIEHLIEQTEGAIVHRIKASSAAKVRNAVTRSLYRKNKFETYFRESLLSDFLIYRNEAVLLYNSMPARNVSLFREGTLIGLNHDDDTIALGILDDVSDDAVTFRSPIGSSRKINRIIFGDIMHPDYL
ncbi:MAG: Clp1/GlmU family protein [Nitrospirota bacterium]